MKGPRDTSIVPFAVHVTANVSAFAKRRERRRVEGASIHTPWRLDARARAWLDYPAPLVDPARFDPALRVRGAA